MIDLSGDLFESEARLEDLIGSFQNEELALQDPVFGCYCHKLGTVLAPREDVTELNDGGGRHRALPGGCAQLKNSPSTSMAADW